MRKFTESDIFQKMNLGGEITKAIQNTLRSINEKTIINDKIGEALSNMNKAYRDNLTTKVIDAVKKGRILIMCFPPQSVLPANMPFIKVRRGGTKDCMVVDMTKYCTVKRNNLNEIVELKIDVAKLYAILVPAYIALEVLNESTIISTESIKNLALLWAKMFNKILMSQKIFVGNEERYEAFMYFAMKFFMLYYMGTPAPVVDNIAGEFIKDVKSKCILTIENNLQHKGIDLYADWETFARTMFSNEITNIKSITNVDMNIDQYLRLFSTYMGRDGAYLSLWSADYAFFCFFAAWNHAWIMNDRSFEDVVNADAKLMPTLLRGLVKEI